MDNIEKRLTRLERENKIWRVAGIIGGILVVVVLALSMMGVTGGSPVTVTAQEFEVVDSQGNRRAFLGLDEEDSPALIFGSSQGNPRVMLAVMEDGLSALGFYDENGNPIWSAP